MKKNSNSETEVEGEPRRSEREKRVPIRCPGNLYSNNVYANYCKINTPSTFEEAIESDNCRNGKKAMKKEIECLNKKKDCGCKMDIHKEIK